MPAGRAGSRPSVRLRTVPPHDPPYDDESAAQIWTAGPGRQQLTLDLFPAGTRAPTTRPGGGRPPARPGFPPFPPDALANATPEARQAARRFLNTCLEILNGYRPVAHVRSLARPADAEAVVAQLAAGIERLAVPRQRTADRREPVRVRLMRVCEPRPGVAEAAAALGSGARRWAIAFRLERQRGSWVSTAIRVI